MPTLIILFLGPLTGNLTDFGGTSFATEATGLACGTAVIDLVVDAEEDVDKSYDQVLVRLVVIKFIDCADLAYDYFIQCARFTVNTSFAFGFTYV